VLTVLGVLGLNLFTALLMLARKLRIAESGRMLSRIDEPLRGRFSRPVVQ
jgi:hypothetical protein